MSEDFTEAAYAELVELAKRGYSFEPFGTDASEPHVLWRHDVDYSVHRALRLAEIEAEAGVRSTYFLHLHSAFYNLLERPVFERAQRLLEHGHWLGLHFDAGFRDGGDMESEMAAERDLLERLFGRAVEVVSFHNPEATGVESIGDERLAGMVNAYGDAIRERYSYVSDSNGYWRYRRLGDVLEAADEKRLHVLTHPEWWQAEPMSPRDRIARCAEGRAQAALAGYDELLALSGRDNIR